MNKLLVVGTVAFDAIETPFGKTDKILGGAGTFIGLSASNFVRSVSRAGRRRRVLFRRPASGNDARRRCPARRCRASGRA